MSKLKAVLSDKELAIDRLNELDDAMQREVFCVLKRSMGERVVYTKKDKLLDHGGPMLISEFKDYLDSLSDYYSPSDDRYAELRADIMARTTFIHQAVCDRAWVRINRIN